VNGLILVLYLVRREPNALIEFPFAWLISIVTTLIPFLYRPIQEAFLLELLGVGYYLQIIGLVIIIGSLLSLRGSIGIVPANRGIKKGGFYQIVRHPLYASELLFFQWLCLVQPSVFNFFLLVLVFACNTSEAGSRRLLINDPGYKLYMSCIRYRFIPGLL